MQLGTPPEQIIPKPAAGEYKALGTLETMHEVLASRGLDDLPMDAFDATHQRQAQLTYKANGGLSPTGLPLYHKATVWVVRYVDYTSKYGLGFLLNTGSAGVYFNDSTKIVLSPDGSIFQYVERRRKDAQGQGTSSSEHTIQTHLVSYYPSELQKKVTLLRHFRNYLVDQQREGASRAEDGSAAGGSHGMETIAMASLDGTNSGASSSVPFGASSIALKTPDALAMGCMGTAPSGLSGASGEAEMPFLKKWVRTRHAILFRLSNRTVQVLFFDRSEVLLSSEARMVTYVNKQGARSEHSLEEVLQTGRTDIAKRLKYAKDIMYRLISTQAR
jgi:polo-like kinase 1